MNPLWELKTCSNSEALKIEREFSLHPVTARILSSRGITAPDVLKAFLKNDLNDLSSPFELDGIEQSAARIKKAVDSRERILIYGDYDVDGITATSILIRFFRVCGLEALYFIPDRMEDGYGISIESAGKISEQKPDLVITVDCGVTAVEPVRKLREAGADVIITDHHIPGDTLPDTPYLVNPRLSPGTTSENLAGAGVAFKLAWGCAQKVCGKEKVDMKFRTFLVDALSLVTLGTVSDIVPLTGENRIITSQGLSLLKTNRNITGLNSLCASAGIKEGSDITTFDIGFKLGPRLNAAGRMANASKCVRLLTTDSVKEADAISAMLEAENRIRQKLCKDTVEEAMEMLGKDLDPDRKTVVLAGESWHRGIIGIVASNITDKCFRPAVILSRDEADPSLWHGSARSIDDFHITDALKQCAEHLQQYGGHKGAAGLLIRDEQIEPFISCFEKTGERLLAGRPKGKKIVIDTEAEPSDLEIGMAFDLRKLEPFGESNRKPLVLSRGLKIAREPRLVGADEKHLKLQLVSGPGRLVDAIGFNMGHRLQEIYNSKSLDLVYFPSINEFNGRTSLDLQIRDLAVNG